jgi:hypothetical protein
MHPTLMLMMPMEMITIPMLRLPWANNGAFGSESDRTP